MNDIRVKLLNHFQTGAADGQRHTVAVKFTGGVGGAMENTIRYIVVGSIGVSSNYQHLMAQLFQAFLEDFYMGHHAVDMGQVGFGKKSDSHDTPRLTNALCGRQPPSAAPFRKIKTQTVIDGMTQLLYHSFWPLTTAGGKRLRKTVKFCSCLVKAGKRFETMVKLRYNSCKIIDGDDGGCRPTFPAGFCNGAKADGVRKKRQLLPGKALGKYPRLIVKTMV